MHAARRRSGVSVALTGTLGILAGGGALPLVVAAEAMAAGRSVHILAIDGFFGDTASAPCPVTPVGLGQVGGILDTIKRQNITALVIAGHVDRPEIAQLKLDFGALLALPKLATLMLGGDNHLLTTIIRFFEAKGVAVVGADEIAPGLLAGGGQIGRVSPSSENEADLKRGFEIWNAWPTYAAPRIGSTANAAACW